MTEEETLLRFQPLLKKEAARNFLPYLREDVEAVATLHLLRAIRTFDPARGIPFAGYAKALVHGGVTTFLRREKRLRERHDYSAEIDTAQAPDEAKKAEIREILRKVLATLTKEERAVFVRLFLQGLTAKETALQLSMSYSKVKAIKTMIKLRLKNLLAQ